MTWSYYPDFAYFDINIYIYSFSPSADCKCILNCFSFRVLLRKPPLKKSKVPLKYQVLYLSNVLVEYDVTLKYQGIKRVKSKSKTQLHDHGGLGREGGYSQKEVNMLLFLITLLLICLYNPFQTLLLLHKPLF